MGCCLLPLTAAILFLVLWALPTYDYTVQKSLRIIYDEEDLTACDDDSWKYDSQSKACFKIMDGDRSITTWGEGSEDCRKYLGGTNNFTQPGHLAKIESKATSDFIKELSSDQDLIFWIGLYLDTAYYDYKWDGFPGKRSRYNELNDDLTSSRKPFTTIRGQQWVLESNGDAIHHRLCQHYPLPKQQHICPPLMREFTKWDQPMSFLFFYSKWDSFTLKKDTELVVSCFKDQDEECRSQLAGFEVVQHYAKKPALTLSCDASIIMRSQAGVWTLQINDTKVTRKPKTCIVQVYVPPSPVRCKAISTSTSIRFDCVTDKVYPAAVCEWSYKRHSNESFRPITDDYKSKVYHQDSYLSGIHYFVSTCTITLTDSVFKSDILLPGQLIVQALLYPGIIDPDASFIEEFGIIQQTSVNIANPTDSPEWRWINGSTIGPKLQLDEGDVIDLRCEINTGYTGVDTTVLCGFPITDADDYEQFTTGNLNHLRTKATQKMNDKVCVCWGMLVNGDTDAAYLRFEIRVALSGLGDDQSDTEADPYRLLVFIVAVVSTVVFVNVGAIGVISVMSKSKSRPKAANDTTSGGSDSLDRDGYTIPRK